MIYEHIINLHLRYVTPVDPPTAVRVMNQVCVGNDKYIQCCQGNFCVL